MAIAVECPKCRTLNGLARKVCSKCNSHIPASGVRYWLRFRDDGVSRKESIGKVTLRQARELDQQRTTSVKAHRRVDSDLTWTDLSDRYLSKLKAENASKRYLVDSLRFFERLIDYFGANTSVSQTTPALIRDYRSELRNAGLSEASCDRHLAAGKAAWNYAVDEIKNPFSRVKMYNPENEVVRFLSDEERNRLLGAAMNTHRNLYEMLVITMSTGMRKSNVINLKRSEVDFETGIITVTQKGGLTHTTIMNDSCRTTLESIPDNGTDYFWLTKHGTPYRVDWRKPWERAKRLAGIQNDFRWHDLRHDAGTRIYSATGDIYATQTFLGHRQLSTTKRYAHFLKDKLQATAEVLNVPCPTRVLSIAKKP
jgi:site-specific recombinase XerD